ncbi:MAG: sigma-70 family RNA polymerase sigma factor [Planctomycetes bacterium]|nr:sigma-70 family RNA polymerase sigma factor [Planctomycetota bacterium]
MTRDALTPLIRAATVAALETRPDTDLLAKFAATRDEDAFAALVRRHGPLVLGICRRNLGNEADAEDAFQAVFLVLARKVDAIRWRESARGWLYKVAVRIAKDARNRRAVRAKREREAAFHREAATPIGASDFAVALDAELAELPEKYRDVLIACCLDGKSRDEVAADLGVPTGTVKIRLERGRDQLRKRLAARGVEFGAALAAVTIAGDAVAGSVVGNTSRVAAAWLAGDAGAVSAGSLILVKGACRAMFAQKLRAGVLGIVGIVMAVAGVGFAFGLGADGRVEPAPVAANFAPVPLAAKDKPKPAQKIVSKPDKYGIVTVLRPFVRSHTTGDPVRVALHFETENGPLDDKLPNGDKMPVISRLGTAKSLTFIFTGPDGKSSTLKTVITTDGKIQEPVFQLSQSAGFYLTLTNTGPREEQVGAMLRDVQDSWNTYYNYGGWADDAKIDLSAPGQYTLRIAGELAAGDAGVIPFESGTITFERLKDGATTFKELAATAKAALPAGTKLDDLKDFLTAPLVVENADGTRVVHLRSSDSGKWNYAQYTVAVTQDGKAGKIESFDVSTCVARGTRLDGEAGSVRIEDVGVGDRIWGYDPVAAKRVLTTVRGVTTNVAGTTLSFGGTLRVTGNHPVYVNGKWKRADAVAPNDTLLTETGLAVRAGVPKQVRGAIEVFDLTVDEPHTYFAGGFLVHNKDRMVRFTPNLSAYYQLWPGELPALKK